jgi:integrase
MQTDLRLSGLIEGVLREIGTWGLCPELNRQYRRIHAGLKRFAQSRGTDCYSEDLLACFVADVERRFGSGGIGHSRRNHLRRASFLLRDYVENGSLQWRVYRQTSRPMPSSGEFLRRYGQYIDGLRSAGRSENTVASAKNIVPQFLLFLEDGGYESLAETPRPMVPSFFQHLQATYQPTSIRIAASVIRSFLSFTEDGEPLLSLLPSRCLRNKPIIPILSEQEYAALKAVLRRTEVPLRDRAIIQLALRTGLRAVDILGLELRDIDWANDTLCVRQSKTGRPLKLPLSTDVGNLLSSYILTERPKADTPFVFLRFQAPHKPLSDHAACYAVVRRVFARAGIRQEGERKGIHVIRHSVASRMLAHGVALPIISTMLGHADKHSTEVYLATDGARLRECALPLTPIPVACGGLR